jgi:hypothetical protein
MGGIGEPSWLRDEDFEGSTPYRAKSLKDVFERCWGGRAWRFDVDIMPYPLIRRMERAATPPAFERADTASMK